MAHPTSADAETNRSFSGPPHSAAEVRGTCSDETCVSLETAKAALLQLRDSITWTEFQKLMEGVADTNTNEANEKSTVSENSETPVIHTEMDTTSSDVGSTVRELNEQLLPGEGNTGSVSTESVVPGQVTRTPLVTTVSRFWPCSVPKRAGC